MTDILNSDALLLTTAEHLVICVPNNDSATSLAQQDLAKASLRHTVSPKDLKKVKLPSFPTVSEKRWPLHIQLFSELKTIKDTKFQKFLDNFTYAFWSLPNEVYLPVLIDDKITELTPDIVERYEEQIITKKAVEDYEEKLVYQAKNIQTFAKEFKTFQEFLNDPQFYPNVPAWLSEYGVKDTESLFKFIHAGYTQDSQLEYWINLATENPHFLTQADNHLLYRGSQLQSSIQQLVEIPSLEAFPQAYVIFLQETVEKGIFFLHYELKGKKAHYTFTDKVSESLGVFFSEEQLRSSGYTNFRALPDDCFVGHYTNGKLQTFIGLNKAYQHKEKIDYLENLNIVLEQAKLQHTVGQQTLSGTSTTKRFKL